jgi:hypothetical protein
MDSSLEEEILLYKAPFWVAHKQLQMMKTQSAKTHTLHGFWPFQKLPLHMLCKRVQKDEPRKPFIT